MHMRKKLIVGNWKMNPRTVALARSNFLAIKKGAKECKNVTAAIAAPFVFLPELSKSASAGLALGAQNVSAEKEGAFTGEVSAAMLSGMKVSYVIIGHSERRSLGETNEFINKKIKIALASGLTPIICVGEKERTEAHDMWYLSVVKTQLEECLAGLPKAAVGKIVIAYEPVWALSSTANRRDATPDDCVEMHIYIKKVLSDMFGAGAGMNATILYGGSVDEKNALGFLTAGHADGLLPGRASLTPKTFISILKIANEIR